LAVKQEAVEFPEIQVFEGVADTWPNNAVPEAF
jgi:hypothetical protein